MIQGCRHSFVCRACEALDCVIRLNDGEYFIKFFRPRAWEVLVVDLYWTESAGWTCKKCIPGDAKTGAAAASRAASAGTKKKKKNRNEVDELEE